MRRSVAVGVALRQGARKDEDAAPDAETMKYSEVGRVRAQGYELAVEAKLELV